MTRRVPGLHPALRAHVEAMGSGCWIWTGPVDPDGYAITSEERGALRVHAVVWEQLVGPLKGDGLLIVCPEHRADEGGECLHMRCVAPAHMAVVVPRSAEAGATSWP